MKASCDFKRREKKKRRNFTGVPAGVVLRRSVEKKNRRDKEIVKHKHG